MAITVLDKKTALIVIDLQKGILDSISSNTLENTVQNCLQITEAFRERQYPVVLVNVEGKPEGRTDQSNSQQGKPQAEKPKDWAELIPALNTQESDHIVTKKTPGAFTHTDLEAYLKANDVTQVVVVGVVTSIGVETTARQAFELGFNVTLVTDAMTDFTDDMHAWAITKIFPRIAETGTTQALLACL